MVLLLAFYLRFPISPLARRAIVAHSEVVQSTTIRDPHYHLSDGRSEQQPPLAYFANKDNPVNAMTNMIKLELARYIGIHCGLAQEKGEGNSK